MCRYNRSLGYHQVPTTGCECILCAKYWMKVWDNDLPPKKARAKGEASLKEKKPTVMLRKKLGPRLWCDFARKVSRSRRKIYLLTEKTICEGSGASAKE